METETQAEKPKKTAKRPGHGSSGWIPIHEPADLERAIVRMLNKILSLEKDKAVEQAGRFASLANAWVNVRKLSLESEEIVRLRERVAALEAVAKEKERDPPIRVEAFP